MSCSGFRRKLMIASTVLFTLCGSAALAQIQVAAYGGRNVASVRAFDSVLAPYGTWEYVSSYGRVWRPNPYYVGPDFQPYSTGGRWVYTDYGWYWRSDWNWGWATFHYGRWAYDPVLGWVWVPGTEWAPAWVQWRIGGGFVGWCPLGPSGYGWGRYGHRHYWNFVETRHFQSPNPIHYAVPSRRFHHVMSLTQPIHREVSYSNVHWAAGPEAQRIETRTHQAIVRVGVRPPAPGHIHRARIEGGAHFGEPRGLGHPAPPRFGGAAHAPSARPSRPPTHFGGAHPAPSRPGFHPPTHFGGHFGGAQPAPSQPRPHAPAHFGGHFGGARPAPSHSRPRPPSHFDGHFGGASHPRPPRGGGFEGGHGHHFGGGGRPSPRGGGHGRRR